ncbi:hypothetical protein C8R44DRAFT_872328 [Mycena epipterygia]|nr:hypothetical protein C8R44DRAFT_872328 [Mycena epipterygia]
MDGRARPRCDSSPRHSSRTNRRKVHTSAHDDSRHTRSCGPRDARTIALRERSATPHARVRPAFPRSAAALLRTYDFTHLRSHFPQVHARRRHAQVQLYALRVRTRTPSPRRNSHKSRRIPARCAPIKHTGMTGHDVR